MDKVKVVIEFFGIGLHLADYYTDIATTKLYWDNCQYKFFGISIGIFIYSHVATVLYFCFYTKAKLYRAMMYPYIVLRILFRKLMIQLKRTYI